MNRPRFDGFGRSVRSRAAGILGGFLTVCALTVCGQETRPPSFTPLEPPEGGIGVDRSGALRAALVDDTGVDPLSIRVQFGETPPIGLDDPRLQWVGTNLTFTPAMGAPWGPPGETVTVRVSAADVWGNALEPVPWTFTLALETVVNERVVLVGRNLRPPPPPPSDVFPPRPPPPQELELVELRESTARFSYGEGGHGLRVGDVLVGLLAEGPYYREALEVYENPATREVTITTRDADLTDVFRQTSLHFQLEQDFAIPSGELNAGAGPFLVTLSEREGVVATRINIDCDIRPNALGLPEVDRVRAELAAGVELTVGLKVAASAAGQKSIDGPILLPRRTLARVPLRVGFVPVEFALEFEIGSKFDLEAEVQGEVEATTRLEKQLVAGVARVNGQWRDPFLNATPLSLGKIEVTPRFEGKVRGRGFVLPRLRLAIVRALGITAQAEPYLIAGGTAWWDDSGAGLQRAFFLVGGVNGSLQVGGKAPWEKDYEPWKTWPAFESDKKLFWGSVPLRVSPVLDIYQRDYGSAESEYPVKFESADFLPDDSAEDLSNPPKVLDPGPCVAVGDHPLTPAGGNDPVYRFVPQEGVLHIEPRTLLIKAADAKRTVGSANPVFHADFSGLEYGCDTEADFGLTFSTTADLESQPGPYDIVVSMSRPNPNYRAAFKSGRLTVEEKAENFTWLTEDAPGAWPRAALDAAGIVHVVFANLGRVYYRQATTSGVPVSPIREIFANAHSPDIAVDDLGQVHLVALISTLHRIAYARLDAAGNVQVRSDFGPGSLLNSDFLLSSPRVALDSSSGLPVPVVGVLESTHQWLDYFLEPPLFPGPFLGSITSYIVILGIQATMAMPSVIPGSEIIPWYRLDADGQVSSRGAIYQRWDRQPFPETMHGLSMAVDADGTAHFVWRETREGETFIAWKTEHDNRQDDPVRLARSTAGGQSLSWPEVAAQGRRVAVAWAGPAEVRLAEVRPALRYLGQGAEVSLLDRVGLAAAGADWRLAWADAGRGQLFEAVRGWDEAGASHQGEARRLVGVATEESVGAASRVFMPTLASRGQAWALVFAASRTAFQNQTHVAIYSQPTEGNAFALVAGSALWDRWDYREEGSEASIPLRCTKTLLARREGICAPVEGVVADGVTPLLFRFAGVKLNEVRLAVTTDQAGAAAAIPLLHGKLSTAGGFNARGEGSWRPGLVQTLDPGQENEELHLQLAGFSLTDLAQAGVVWPAAGTRQQLKFELGLYRNRAGEPQAADRIASVTFLVRKPPVFLVHGYNADSGSWSAEFLTALHQVAGPDGVLAINYGTDYIPNAPAAKSGYYLNTLLDLRSLRMDLARTLEVEEDYLRRRWAMTRYDAVGHSQGGVLLRSLCAREFGSETGFINERNFGRGRFHRVITIGSPHNGSRLAHYLSTLKRFIEERRQDGERGVGADQLFLILDGQAPNILQPKFDPFLTTHTGFIRQLNGQVPTHASAPIHVLSTVIDHTHEIPGSVFWLFGLWTDERMETVLPRGPAWGSLVPRSDGVVDYRSHFGGVVDSNLRSTLAVPVAHAEPRLLFGAPSVQGASPEVAARVASLLAEPNRALHFGPFVNPEPLGPDVQTAIDSIADQAAREALDVRRAAELALKIMRIFGDPQRQIELLVELVDADGDQQPGLQAGIGSTPPRPPPSSDVLQADQALWMVQVYSPDPLAEQLVRWEPSTNHPGGIVVRIPDGLRAQIVAMAAAPDVGLELQASEPTVLYDTLTEHVRGLVIAGVVPPVYRWSSGQARLLALLDDGGTSPYYVEQPETVSWASSAPEIMAISPGGEFTTREQVGSAEITVRYREWTGQLKVQVLDQMPEVIIRQPADLSALASSEPVTVEIEASDPDGSSPRVVLYVNDEVARDWPQAPYRCEWSARPPGDYVLQAVAYDATGSRRGSLPVRISVTPQPPAVAWVAPAPETWCAGAIRLEGTVVDPDPGDTATAVFEYSVNSSDGLDGEWWACAPPVSAPPYAVLWQSQPPSGLDDQVWLRLRATDGRGLNSAAALRRIKIDNSFFGAVIQGAPAVRFDPHPGEDSVALIRPIVVQFGARPTRPDGTALSDAALASWVVLKDGAGAAVPALAEVSDGGLTVRLVPGAPLQPRRTYTIQLTDALAVAGQVIPPASSSFRTTFGVPAALVVSARPVAPAAGAAWEPPLEVMIVDALGNRVESATGTISLTLRVGGEQLGTAESTAQLGVARFRGLRSEKAGRVLLEFACPEPALEGTEDLEVLPGLLASFRLETAPQVEAGQPVALVATALDAYGNVKTDYQGLPVLSSGDPLAVMSPLTAFRLTDRGTRAYSDGGRLRSLGSQWLQLAEGDATSARAALRVLNAAPSTPVALAPTQGGVCGLAPRLEASPFADVDNATHGASQWQVATNGLFDSPLWDSLGSGPATSVMVPPGVLAPNTDYYWRVRYQDDPANDDAPRWSAWSAPAGMRTAHGFPFVDDFAADRGWRASPEGIWSRTAASGLPAGSPTDDTSEGDDRQILTTASNGGPPSDLAGADRIVSPAVDCSGQRVVELSFRRWLQADSSDWAQAEVEVSLDGSTWIPVWRNGADGVADDAWREQRIDLTEIAAGQPTVYLGFSLGPLHNALPLTGWHIDDVRLHNGIADQVVATLSVASTVLNQGDVFEARILVREQMAEAPGFLGGSFDVFYDASGLELISPANADQVVRAPFNEVKTEGLFTTGRITGLGGATLTAGSGNGEDVPFAVLTFRAVQPGSFGISLAAGTAGCVLAPPVGLVGQARVRCGEPLTIQVQPPPVVPMLEFRLEGPPDPVVTGDTFELRLAVRENHPLARGFFGGAVDLFFDESLVEPVAPLNLPAVVDAAFQSLGILSGAIAESRIDELGGVTLTEGLADGTFVTYLRVPFRAKRPGNPGFTVGPSQAGLVLASPVGQLASQEVDWGPGLAVPVVDWPIAQVGPAISGWLNRRTLDLTVGGAGIVEYRQSLDGAAWSEAFSTNEPIQLRSLTEGAHELRVLGRNERGAWQDATAATTVRWSVDTVAPSPPTLRMADPAVVEWSSRPETTLQWTGATDQHSGLQGYRVAWASTAVPPAMEGELVSELPPTHVFQESGERWLHIVAVDLAGNAGAVTTLGPLRYDRDPPQIQLPARIETVRETRIPLSTVEPHSGMASAVWSVVGGSAQDVVLSEAGPDGVTVRANANATYTLQVLVTDRVGNQASRTVEFVFGRRPPRVVNVQIAAGTETTVENPVPVTLTLDRGDADRVESMVRVNGEASDWTLLEGASSTHAFTVNLGNEDGRKEVCVLLRDADYPSGTYTSEPGCGVVWLDRRAWSFAIQVAGAVNPDVRFGESLRATDGFDDGLDVRATIADPWENQVRLSQLQGGASVYADFKQTRSEQDWLLVVAAGASSIDLSWTPASMPSWVYLEIVPARRLNNQWVPNGVAVSLRAVAGMSAGPGSQFFLLRKLAEPQANTAPAVGAQPLQTVAELATLNVTMTATDADQPAQTVTFSLVNPPGGASIHSTSGVFTWTPTEAQGPGTYTITVVATDNGTPALSGTNTFQVNVTEANTAPTVAGIPDQTVAELSTLTVTNVASDADLPANTLAFSLINPPPGLSLDSATGVLIWTPVVGQGGSNYVVRVRVSDQGVPPLFATNTINIRVNPAGGTTQPAVLAPISADASGFRLQVTGQPRGRYGIEASGDLVRWTVIGNVTLGDGPTTTFLDSRTIEGGKQFYRAVAGGGGVTPAATLAVAGFDGGGFRFTLTGQPGARYTVEFSTDMVQWSDRDTVTLGDGPTASYTDARAVGGTLGFYRVRSP